MEKCPCVTLIGMAASGKSTVGLALAKRLDWAHVDTDHLIEAAYGKRLQDVTDSMTKEEFLDVEGKTIEGINMQRTVLSTGGSVIYREGAMRHLQSLGPVVHLDVPLPLILKRIAQKPDRGLAIGPGQTIEDLFREREALYRRWQTCSILAGDLSIKECVDAIYEHIAKLGNVFITKEV